ncbi:MULTISPECIES: DUF6776 family protein [unclassified Thioalkalivibrio]|uniref:DUF6776 family protein n=1 Tax=unclassified Thioalkalivibrio TaxID=2621013 RepID=UPI0003707E02|nr:MULTISPECIES: DUF6776 family protein [unclassified Thioalkalivibrio]
MSKLPTPVPRRRPRIPPPRPVRQRRRRWGLGVLLLAPFLLVAGIGGWLWMHWPDEGVIDPQVRIDALTGELQREVAARQQAEAEQQRARRQLSLLEAEKDAYREDVERQEAELARLRDEVAFYERLAENNNDSSLGLRDLALQATGQSGVWDVVFQIYRAGLNRSLDVSWSLEITGRFEGDDEDTTLDQDELGVEQSRSIEGFRLLRNVRARVVLPEDFTPEGVTVRVEPDEEDGPEPTMKRGEWDRMTGEGA